MKLEVGMYVRTEWGTIQKIKEQRDYCECIADEDEEKVHYFNINQTYQEYELIIKASHNIIDLIEVGDYVNGKEVAYIDEFGKYIAICENDITTRDFEGRYEFAKIKKEDIKSIVTKEQFESMSYKV